MFQLEFTTKAAKNFKKMDKKNQVLILSKLQELAVNSKESNNIKPLKGSNYFRLRVANYSVIYVLQNDELIILIIDVNHRKDIY
jgi:mRNA interferase RelE/StbE